MIVSKLQAERVQLLSSVVVSFLEGLVALVATLQRGLCVFGGAGGGGGIGLGQLDALGGEQFRHEAHPLLVVLEFAEGLEVCLIQLIVHLLLEQRERERTHAGYALARCGAEGRTNGQAEAARTRSTIFGRDKNSVYRRAVSLRLSTYAYSLTVHCGSIVTVTLCRKVQSKK